MILSGEKILARLVGAIGKALVCLLALLAWEGLGAEKLTTNDIAGAAKILGLEFSERETSQMLKTVENRLGEIEALQKASFPNALQPAFYFDPRPEGFKMPVEERAFSWEATKIAKPETEEDLAFATVGELASLLRAKLVTAEELTRLSLARLKRHGPELLCVATLAEERALAAARRADEEMAQGKWRGPLHGIPCGVKDLLDMAGLPSGWGVSLYTNRVAERDATVVRKLEEAGAVIVAKLSLGELAMGDVWHAGRTRNPWDRKRGSSGSSAGSSSAVAAGLVAFAIGTETHGSIVSPAMTCGITGLRPTFGRVSRAGAMTLSFSMDKIGVLARCAEDTAMVLEAIRGADGLDRAVVEAPLNYPTRERLKEMRIGYLEADFKGNYAEKTNDLAALEALRGAGFELKAVAMPAMERRTLSRIIEAEGAAFFDEMTRSGEDDRLAQQDDWNWPNAFRAARLISAVDYLQANRARAELMERMDALFQEVDLIVAPAWRGNQLYFSNLTGHPTVLVPNGDAAAAPAGFCILAGLYREGEAIALAAAYQEATKWHQRRPKMEGSSAD